MAAGLRPHQFLTIRIGAGEYTFRTFAFAQVFYADSHLRALWRALRAVEKDPSKADAVQDPLYATAGIVCPELVKEFTDCPIAGCEIEGAHADLHHMKPEHWTRLKQFYMQQDWKRLVALLSLGTPSVLDDAEKGPDGGASAAERAFLIMCATAARYFNMSTLDFACLRFEDGCDMLTTLFLSREMGGERAVTPEKAFDALMAEFGGANVVEGMGPIFKGKAN